MNRFYLPLAVAAFVAMIAGSAIVGPLGARWNYTIGLTTGIAYGYCIARMFPRHEKRSPQ